MQTIKEKLVSAVTQYDMRQQGKRGYNPYALSLYLERVESVATEIEKGTPVSVALRGAFNDRLLDALLRAVA